MITIHSENKLDNLVQNDNGCWVNFNQKLTTITEHRRNEDGTEEDIEKEVYRVYQQWYATMPTLRNRKQAVLDGIAMYDKSSSVNTFKYNGKNYWLDRETRVSVMNTTNILKASGEENATLWVGDMELTLPCDTIISILTALEKYALACYNVTQRHINAVKAMTLEEAYEYDFETGYPEPLEFNV